MLRATHIDVDRTHVVAHQLGGFERIHRIRGADLKYHPLVWYRLEDGKLVMIDEVDRAQRHVLDAFAPRDFAVDDLF